MEKFSNSYTLLPTFTLLTWASESTPGDPSPATPLSCRLHFQGQASLSSKSPLPRLDCRGGTWWSVSYHHQFLFVFILFGLIFRDSQYGKCLHNNGSDRLRSALLSLGHCSAWMDRRPNCDALFRLCYLLYFHSSGRLLRLRREELHLHGRCLVPPR